jgi:hypothetical protein
VRTIVGLIVSRSLIVVLLGVIPGLLMASVFSGRIQPLLNRTSAIDSPTFGVAAALMFIVAVVASTLPALTAAPDRSQPRLAQRVTATFHDRPLPRRLWVTQEECAVLRRAVEKGLAPFGTRSSSARALTVALFGRLAGHRSRLP